MKITNSEIIKTGERELIDTIIADLDWEMIETIVKNRHKLKIQDDIDYRQGDLIVHEDKVAYKLDFDVKMTLSIIFDRDGNYLSVTTSDDLTGNDILEPAETEALSAPTDDTLTTEEELSSMDSEADESLFSENVPAASPDAGPTENFSKMASHIANMISEINDD